MSIPANSLIRIPLPPAVRSLLSQVRARIRRDAFTSGLLMFVCFVVIVFWTTTTLDAGWFRLQRLELPVGLRAILLAGLLPASLWFVTMRILLPLVRRMGDSDLALLLERQFPQFQDRLITSVESSQGLPQEGPLAGPMLERSIREAAELANTVIPADVFDVTSLKRWGMYAGGLSLSMAVTALLQPQLLTRWWKAFIQCDEIYHERTTELEMTAVAQPGDRRIAFRQIEEALQYRHPRGADLELEIRVPDDRPAEGRTWVVPDRVRVDVLRVDGSRSRTYVSPSASTPRNFRFVITRLQEPIEIELLAGDFRSRTPYRVDVVNPPGLDRIQLKCRYPDYTGWNQQRETALTITGSEVQLPVGTGFELAALSAKPLQAARIVSDQFELSGDRSHSRLTLRDGRSVESNGVPLISPDGLLLTGQFRIDPAPDTAGPAPETEARNTAAQETASGKQTSGNGDPASRALPIVASTSLRFFLHDEDDVMSVSPETLRVQGIPDKPPVVVAQMTGIDTAVTRLAGIPVAARIRDDYGVQSAEFSFLVDDETNWRPRPFRNPPPEGTTDFSLLRNPEEPFEIFSLQPLELSEGQTLTLSVVATDGNPAPGPGTTRSEPMRFRIVSIEELLSLLYAREIALRSRFEEVIAQLEEISSDLQIHEQVADRIQEGNSTTAEDRASLNTCATRSGNNWRRQTNELSAIVEGFEEIVRQLVNNAVPPQQLAENMRTSIVDPLKSITTDSMSQVDSALGAFRVAAQDGRAAGPMVRDCRAGVTEVISALKQILENVRDMAEFHEALRDLKAILDEQQKNLERTRKLQKNQLLEDLLK